MSFGEDAKMSDDVRRRLPESLKEAWKAYGSHATPDEELVEANRHAQVLLARAAVEIDDLRKELKKAVTRTDDLRGVITEITAQYEAEIAANEERDLLPAEEN